MNICPSLPNFQTESSAIKAKTPQKHREEIWQVPNCSPPLHPLIRLWKWQFQNKHKPGGCHTQGAHGDVRPGLRWILVILTLALLRHTSVLRERGEA